MSGNAKKSNVHHFIDCTKEFDIVKRDMLFEILSKAGVPDKVRLQFWEGNSARKPESEL